MMISMILCAGSEELCALTGPNVIEEIGLEAHSNTDQQCNTGDEWGRLDAVLANGFPKLYQVSLHISVFSSYSNAIALQEKWNKLPEEQFPRLSESTRVMFNFLTEVQLL
jgi:hypothetical protein